MFHIKQDFNLGRVGRGRPYRRYLPHVDTAKQHGRSRLQPTGVAKVRAVWNGVSAKLRIDEIDERECQDREASKDKGSNLCLCGHEYVS